MVEAAAARSTKGHSIRIVESSRHVRVELDGIELADTSRATLLYEGSLPVRYYIPQADVRMDLLTPTETRTRCPFKGEAVYWSATVGDKQHEDVVWSYPQPIAEAQGIANLMSFFNERVDIYIDDEKQECGTTPWSK